MQRVTIQKNLLSPENIKCTEINNCYDAKQHYEPDYMTKNTEVKQTVLLKDGGILEDVRQKNFLHGLQNARNILTNLEDSLQKSNAYEQKLLRCKATHAHAHSHNGDDWWDDGFSKDDDDILTSNSKALNKASSYQVDLTESWSTMSIVCLQYQYEELSKRYESLLQAYNNKCTDVNARDKALSRLKQRASVLHAQLSDAHTTLLSVADKYLALKKRRNVQLCVYENKIDFLKGRVRDVVSAVDKARLRLDDQFSRNMAAELDADYALLLAEMRKSNQLFMENLQLKAQMEELMPGSVNWIQ